MAKQEQVMERAFKGNQKVRQGMERSAIDMTQDATKSMGKELERALERARQRTNTRERER